MVELDWVLTNLAIGPRPTGHHDWQLIKERGITLIIDLNDNSSERIEAEKLGIHYQGVKIEDPPERAENVVEIFHRVQDIVEKEIERGGRVYLHCTAGQQRSPTCAMAYLMTTGQKKETAIRNVRAARLGVWAGPVGVRIWETALDLWDRELSGKKPGPNRKQPKNGF